MLNGDAGSSVPEPPFMGALRQAQRRFQTVLDKSAPHVLYRWVAWVALVIAFAFRIYWISGFYIVTYALAIYNLNLLLGFLSPQVDPELEGPTLPSKSDEEFRPFVRKLPEFKFWYHSFRAQVFGFVATFFSAFDIPVFWPILVLYWFVLFFVTMKRQIMHMVKFRYLPFTVGKKTYGKSGSTSKLSK
ncbi:Rer1 family protein [Helicosporidium sp. ATCC 50920]|nr:Rer1 family protein [Helicosporidium sp. ATCC 50920]|eukprot:KDD75897.1 Rer1 family protein [Helicosporidium sp. ATCC 50920]